MNFGGKCVGSDCVYYGFLLFSLTLIGEIGSGRGFFTEGFLTWLPQHWGFDGLGNFKVGFVVPL